MDVLDQATEIKTKTPSTDVLGQDTEVKTKTPFIDFASLAPHYEFLTESEGGKESIVESLTRFVERCDPDTAPVIRFLIGDDAAKTREEAWSGRELFTDLFWPKNHDGQRVRRVTHPRARIYVGYYNPNFHPKQDDTKVEQLINTTYGVINELAKMSPELATMLGQVDPKKLIKYLADKGLRTITWNHGKVVAVNGKFVMTGGGNLWNAYANKDQTSTGARIDHDIVDHQAKIRGDAAVSAHHWADYFWKYLNSPVETDRNSCWWGANLSDPNAYWFAGHENRPDQDEVPFRSSVKDSQGKILHDALRSPFTPSLANTAGKFPALTVAKLGDWYGPMKEISYPVMIIDAVRDLMINIFWQMHAGTHDDPKDGLGIQIWGVNKLLSDDSKIMQGFLFNKLHINPAAWASRYTRTWAIAYASSSVVICQQMLVQYLTASEPEYQDLVAQVNDGLQMTKDTQRWDGFIWPFDLIVALAQSIGAMAENKSIQELNSLSKNTLTKSLEGVFIVQTTKQRVDRQDWEDQTSVFRIKNRLKRIMKGLPYEAGGIDDNKIDIALDKFLNFKRVMKDDGHFFSHSKIVCVDKKLMYVGSDNAYPCYNEEHGIWVEDNAAIDGWLNNFFKPYWEKCKDPTNPDDPQNDEKHFAALKANDNSGKRLPRLDN